MSLPVTCYQAAGLPSSSLVADKQWHAQLLDRIKTPLTNLETKFGLKQGVNLGNKLSKKARPSTPLICAEDLADCDATALRIDTVHKAIGTSPENSSPTTQGKLRLGRSQAL